MDWILPLAAKSLLIAAGTLLLLHLLRHRSAADRSWIAHLGLGAVALLPIALLAFPALEVVGPAILAHEVAESAPIAAARATDVTPSASLAAMPATAWPVASIDLAFWAYAVPAALLLLITFTALLRLIRLKARAHVLVEPRWLTALAQAQRRIGFKGGAALLTSEEIRSPISWGVLRPVILLNDDATGVHDQAEAILAHELAHIAGWDWAKLLLARITVAVFWFNPLVWLLAREAHQLREEAADDAVLGSDVEDTEYAKLLVGIARHQCRGLLIGVHGMAPARNSLARRVRRILDAASARAPGGWRWSAAAGFFAAGMAVPIAALQIIAPPAVAHQQAAPRAAPSPPSHASPTERRDTADAAKLADAAPVRSRALPRNDDEADDNDDGPDLQTEDEFEEEGADTDIGPAVAEPINYVASNPTASRSTTR